MGRMVRKQVYIAPHQEKLLKRRAKELGVTESELIRRGIDQIGHVTSGLPRDYAAWDKAKAFIEERVGIDAPQTGRIWTRDELYDDHLGHFSC